MKRNLKQEIRSIVNEIELNGVGMVIDTAVTEVDKSTKQLLTLFSTTMDDVIGEDWKEPKLPKNKTYNQDNFKWASNVACARAVNSEKKEARLRKQDLGL